MPLQLAARNLHNLLFPMEPLKTSDTVRPFHSRLTFLTTFLGPRVGFEPTSSAPQTDTLAFTLSRPFTIFLISRRILELNLIENLFRTEAGMVTLPLSSRMVVKLIESGLGKSFFVFQVK